MKSKIFPEMRMDSRSLSNGRQRLQWTYNIQPNKFIQGSHLVADKSKILEPVVIINDVLRPHKDIPSYTVMTKSSRNKDNFYRAIGPILVLGQIFGLMPVCGVLAGDTSHLRFKWRTWRVLYSSVCLVGGTILTSLCVIRLFTYRINIHSVSMLIFYGSTFFTSVLFFRLARKWPMLCRAIEKEESRSVPHSFTKRHMTLIAKFRIITFVILFTALVEHILSVSSGFAMVYGCDKVNTLIIGYYTSSYPQIFSYTQFAYWKAVLLQFFNFCLTLNWNFMDLFIILLSITLASRFEKLNQCVTAAKGKHLPEHFWRVTRNEYSNLANLVGQIDEYVNELIMLSFINNLYIICMQLFNSFDTAHDENAITIPCWKKFGNGILTTLYFVFSFGFLISRFLAVAMAASRIYTNSRIPLATLFSVGSETYCIEVQRFLDHVTNDIVAFTGLKFFYITRGLILTIAGTVVTYELVLVQFNAPPPSVQANITLKNNCGGIESIKTRD